ncbi:hypothetical protein EJ06DRAFT_548845 [Trichodelitschia bisporula]|uniref:Mitochondrial inner membrane protein 1 n=1 Tax=Trichodelitschia bisporula TaxID=703511 RepID=A0A6G1HYG3_9PEZI|nr:hypothetical protein EJ06DRAFT_548845 [Trichodelitschia bisporula]
MLRTAGRSLSRPLVAGQVRQGISSSPLQVQFSSKLCTASSKRPSPLSASNAPTAVSLLRRHYAQSKWDKVDKKAEEKLAKAKIKPTPETVSTESSIRPVFTEVGEEAQDNTKPVKHGLKDDLTTIRSAFDLTDVPPQAYYMGLAGVVPYVVTSLTTVFAAREIHVASDWGRGMFLTQESAETLLHLLEPLQVGYGAVILSFLGAIHWGLEFAGYGGHQGYRRYAIGVVAPAIAWPTIFLPTEYALITQFIGFTGLYYVDALTGRKGWAPAWYGTYRFMLTFIVGASLVVSLVGRGQIADHLHSQRKPAEMMTQWKDTKEQKLAEEVEFETRAAVKKQEGKENAESEAAEETKGDDGDEDSEKK